MTQREGTTCVSGARTIVRTFSETDSRLRGLSPECVIARIEAPTTGSIGGPDGIVYDAVGSLRFEPRADVTASFSGVPASVRPGAPHRIKLRLRSSRERPRAARRCAPRATGAAAAPATGRPWCNGVYWSGDSFTPTYTPC